jgi:hypothetical protein
MTEEKEEKIDIEPILEQVKELIPQGWGKTISCDAGWGLLVAKCHLELLAMDPTYHPYQIKEKFGTLRFYFGTTSDGLKEAMMWEIAQKYEKLSSETCEVTGKPGKLMHKDARYKTLCDDFLSDGWEIVS